MCIRDRGWRLPPAEEEAEGGFTMKEYLKRVVSDDVANSSGGATQYKVRFLTEIQDDFDDL